MSKKTTSCVPSQALCAKLPVEVWQQAEMCWLPDTKGVYRLERNRPGMEKLPGFIPAPGIGQIMDSLIPDSFYDVKVSKSAVRGHWVWDCSCWAGGRLMTACRGKNIPNALAKLWLTLNAH